MKQQFTVLFNDSHGLFTFHQQKKAIHYLFAMTRAHPSKAAMNKLILIAGKAPKTHKVVCLNCFYIIFTNLTCYFEGVCLSFGSVGEFIIYINNI